jgi:hypothetical protein
MNRPDCPACRGPVQRMQRCHGVVASYPCNCWITPDQAQTVVDDYRARLAEADDAS